MVIHTTSFWQRLRYLVFAIAFIGTLVFGLSVMLFSEPEGAQAQKAMFYPESCLGGWQLSKNATGVPDAKDGNYSDKNSAVYNDTGGTIFCGEFSGELPPQTYHTRVTLRFSWSQVGNDDIVLKQEPGLLDSIVGIFVGSEEASNDDNGTGHDTENLIKTDIATTTEAGETSTSTDFYFSTSSELGVPSVLDLGQTATSSETEISEISNEDPSLEPVIDDIGIEPLPELIDETEDQVDDVIEAIELEEAVLDEPEPSDTVVEETAWLYRFINFAHAEELFLDQTSASTTQLPNSEEAEVNPESVTADQSLVSEENIIIADSVNEFGGVDAIFAVEYTLDGLIWQPIGYVSSVNNDVRFELPKAAMTSLADITKIQIALRPLARFDKVQTIYLDAMWLEVSYAPVRELGVHAISTIVPEILSFKDVFVDTDERTTQVNASSSLQQFTENQLAQSLTFIRGVSEERAVAGVQTGTTTELWLVDFEYEQIHRIGYAEAGLGEYPIAAKDKMIFWFNDEGTVLYIYDLRTAGTLHEMYIVANLPNEAEHRLTFPFTDWELVWRDSQFYFYLDSVGEVSQDEDNNGAEQLYEKFSLTKHLTGERLHILGGVHIPTEETGIIEAASISE